MKPYNIELFDKQFNYIYNALINPQDFGYQFDAISPVKNTITMPSDFEPQKLSVEPSAPRGWYIRIYRGNYEYKGVITGYESDDVNKVITYAQPVAIFDLYVPVQLQSGADVIMETFIKTIIENNFMSSSDSQQNIPNLTCITTSSTRGTFNFATKTTASGYDSVNVSTGIISDGVASGIITDVDIDIANKGVNVSIGKKANEITIEGDLPNIINPVFNIRKSNKEINRFTAFDTYFVNGYEFYLHPDGSFDSQDRDRILPIYNSIDFYNSYDVSKSEIDARIDANADRIKALISYNGTLNQQQMDELSAVDFGTPSTMGFSRLGDAVVGEDDWNSYINYKNVYSAAQSGTTYTSTTPVPQNTIYNMYYQLAKLSQYDEYYGEFKATFSDFQMVNKEYSPQYSFFSGHCEELSMQSGMGNYRGTIFSPSNLIEPSHLHVYETYTFKVHIEIKYYSGGGPGGTVIATSTENRDETLYVHTPVYWADVSGYVNRYKGSEAYYDEIKANAQAASESEANLLAQTKFASNKYTNLIELTVSPDDTMIKPLEMEIGQVVNIIHDGTSYNSILSGREIQKNGLVKLIFGTIRLELTKILNMKGI